MSNRIQIRRGTEEERLHIILAAGEPCWCIDSCQMYVGDGLTLGGRPVRATDMSYSRSAFSYRFNEQTEVSSVVEALDHIFMFTSDVSNNFYYGDVLVNDIPDVNSFFSGLSLTQGTGTGPKDIEYISNYTYRVFAYPKVLGTLAGVQDPNFNYLDITSTYENPPRQIIYSGTVFYCYFTNETNLNTTPKTIRYIL
jgi:hypothetical protein